ncbi:MAG: cell envelope integrity protein CreD [Cyclobacteriaceae bacterium]|nr:cell envelope integrity protein CreD [Cyclobacteriaceae bacterium]
MENSNNAISLLDRFNRWFQESVTIKLFSIGFLILILIIPLSWVDDLIYERQARSGEVLTEITSKWSGYQSICGPVIVLPYKVTEVFKEKGKEPRIVEYVEKAFLLPEELKTSGKVEPQVLHRGIYEAAVYQAGLNVNATWVTPDLHSMNINGKVLWNEAYLVFGISDLRGISENPTVMYGEQLLITEPSNELGFRYNGNMSTGLVAKLNWDDENNFNQPFSIQLNFKGSNGLNFIPVGKTTFVNVSGPWSNPSFNGEFLPVSRSITDGGFTAEWKVLHFNRPFTQQWVEENKNLSGSDFGVELLIPVEQYQKSMRTSKYGILIILLTFVSLFLVEISQRIKIHPFQYILMGAALIVYYILLLSLSEQVGYNGSYLISSIATVALLTLYSASFLKSKKIVGLFSGLLMAFYGFIYVIIIQQDFSLLTGSVGLFIVISTLMYLTRKINWYREAV